MLISFDIQPISTFKKRSNKKKVQGVEWFECFFTFTVVIL